MAKMKSLSQSTSNSELIRVHIEVDVPREVYDKVRSGSDRPVDALSGIIGSILGALSAGGELATPDLMGKIKALIGQDASLEDVIPYIEKAINRKQGKFHCQVTIDPVYIKLFSDAASRRGVEVETYIQDVINRIIRSGWVFNMVPEVCLLMTEEQRKQLAQAMEIHESQVNGQAVVEFVKSITAQVSS